MSRFVTVVRTGGSARLIAALALSIFVSCSAASSLAADDEKVAFERTTPQRKGWRFKQTATLFEKVERKYEANGRYVRTESAFWRTRYSCDFEILEVEGEEEVTRARATFSTSVLEDDDGRHDLGLDGKAILLEGSSGERTFSVEGPDAGKLDERQQKFLAAHFDQAEQGPKPRQLFLPEAAVAVGASWELALDPLVTALGVPKGELEREGSSAEARLVSVRDEHETRFGAVAADVTIRRGALDGAPLKNGKLSWKGTLDLSLDASSPFGSLDYETRFSGITVAYRGPTKFVIHFKIDRTGKMSAEPIP